MTHEPGTDGQNVHFLHESIREAILRGDLPPGTEISQVRLAKRLGVSRTPLREALRMLLYEGLLEGEPNRKMRVVGLSASDLEDLFVERLALEAIAIRLTIPRLTGDEIEEMRDCLTLMRAHFDRGDHDAWETPHRELHHALTRHAGRRIVEHLTRLRQHAERYRRLYPTSSWMSGVSEHERIVEACDVRDGDGAARALVFHLGHMGLTILDTLDPTYGARALRRAIAATGAPSLPASEVAALSVEDAGARDADLDAGSEATRKHISAILADGTA